MAARTLIILRRTLTAAGACGLIGKQPAHSLRAVPKFYRRSINLYYATTTPSQPVTGDNPIAASMAQSTTPTGSNAAAEEETKHASFLGEADSDDAHEADREVNPDKYNHNLSDVNASGLHGQAGEGDELIERERKLEALDASQSAYLGEGDSDDAHEADREINPEKYRHNIADASQAAYLGEADSDDAHEGDREVNPEKYRHRIDDAGASGMHGESGEGDEPLDRK